MTPVCSSCGRNAQRSHKFCRYCGELVLHTPIWRWLRFLVWLIPSLPAISILTHLRRTTCWTPRQWPTNPLNIYLISVSIVILLLPASPDHAPVASRRELWCLRLRHWLLELALSSMFIAGLGCLLLPTPLSGDMLLIANLYFITLLCIPHYYQISWFKAALLLLWVFIFNLLHFF